MSELNNNHVENELVLSAQVLSKSYGDLEALTDLSFEMRAGEIMGLLGPNGAGKTTAIRILSTILPPDRGQFTLLDVPHTRGEEIRALIGVLPESMGFPKSMTGGGYLMYMGQLYGQSPQKSRAKAEALLSTFGLDEAGHGRIATYSRGMRQRLGMARALINDPKLLFLDEPTLGFDPKGQQEMLQIIRETAQVNRVAVLISSHLLEVVEEICSRVLILNGGRLITAGKVADIKRRVSTGQSCRIRVPSDSLSDALAALAILDGVESCINPHRQDEILVSFQGIDSNAAIHTILQSLFQGGISIESFARESGRLSDAFLSMIEEVQV